ncbi:O-antigen ligase family protein [Dissulfurimicrobium hydrothermale]|uniref:O-antigen ligase family protein n=1 Tax=Dissulfurimicrobium hydrothermale TaxID=1750598 RepID=UPI001EDC2EE9|nr:O-antigen ligase family protein [Dissulfurimicrobium hydrothermale]UKL13132.1 O-antigen ligase family protein [Dissulfurimicrobium hydrothermale]
MTHLWTRFSPYRTLLEQSLVIILYLSSFLVLLGFIFDIRGESFIFLVLIPISYILLCIIRGRPPTLLKKEPVFGWLPLIITPSFITIGPDLTWRYGKSFVCGIILCLIVYELTSKKDFFYRYLVFLAAIGAFLGLDSIVQGISGMDFLGVRPFWDGRITAIFDNPIHLAFLLSGMAPASLFLMDRRDIKDCLEFTQAHSLIISGFGTLSFLLCITGIILSGTRSAWIAATVMLLPLFSSISRDLGQRSLLIIGASLMAGLILTGHLISERVIEAFGNNPRFYYWRHSIPIMMNSLFLGHGLRSSRVFPANPGLSDGMFTIPHNFFLEITIECGIFAVMIFGYFLYRILKGYIFPCLKKRQGAFLIGMALGPMLTAFISLSFFSIRYNIFVWPCLGLALGFMRNNETGDGGY